MNTSLAPKVDPSVAVSLRSLSVLAAVFALWVMGTGSALAQDQEVVKKASSKQLYEDLIRRTRNVLLAPADIVKWNMFSFTDRKSGEKKKNRFDTWKSKWQTSTLSVYDDSVSESTSPPKGTLGDLPEAAVSGELVSRTEEMQKTLYGNDRRMDLYSAIEKRDKAIKNGVPSPIEAAYVDCSASVGFIVRKESLQKLPSGDYYVTSDGYGQKGHLCKVENFWDQQCFNKDDGIGTGFLVSQTRLCTAGHCVPDSQDVSRYCVVFGYSLLAPQVPESIVIRAGDVYAFKSVIDRKLTSSAEDWALLELDRSCPRPPLKLGSGHPAANSRVFAIGYPSGLPLKISPSAAVRSAVASNQCFIAAVDASGGNSGSPVIAESTREVEGILVRGNEDFRLIKHEDCLRSVVINDAHSGETICSIAAVKR